MSIWSDLSRPTPQWFAGAKLGIFLHWGAYSVPAWAEPIGALGTIPVDRWFRHNPYAEWYYNTIRIEGSPAQQHHQRVHGGAPYDEFLDAWHAQNFDPADWARLFRQAGADYVIPTSKHHDGIALWDAPGTGDRNTVHRGPRRDLIGDIADAVRAEGLRFGVYYSGGLDWSITGHLPPIEADMLRPIDAAYNFYALSHIRDLVDRYRPDVLWNDIDWPDAGKRLGRDGLHELFEFYYRTVPEGAVNDRWGGTHWDFRTSEYAHAVDNEQAPVWENCRGIGYSFGYNRAEDSRHLLSPAALARHWVDVVSRGGRLLLNLGPAADGTIPPAQRTIVESFGHWMQPVKEASRSAMPDPDLSPRDDPWVRWWRMSSAVMAFVASSADVSPPPEVSVDDARVLTPAARIRRDGEHLRVEVDNPAAGPAAVLFPLVR